MRSCDKISFNISLKNLPESNHQGEWFGDTLSAWKVSKYGVISGPYFPVLSPYSVCIHAVSTKMFYVISVSEVYRYSQEKMETLII